MSDYVMDGLLHRERCPASPFGRTRVDMLGPCNCGVVQAAQEITALRAQLATAERERDAARATSLEFAERAHGAQEGRVKELWRLLKEAKGEVDRLTAENGLLAIAGMRATGVLGSAQYPERWKDELNAKEELRKAFANGAGAHYLQGLEHRSTADLTAARARADALEGEAGALREALRKAVAWMSAVLIKSSDDFNPRDVRAAVEALSGTAGIRAAEVLQTARDLMELHDHPDEKRRKMLKADRWAGLRAALAAYDGGGE